MEKIKIYESILVFLIFTLSGMMVFGYTLASDTVGTSGTPTPNLSITPPAPVLVSPVSGESYKEGALNVKIQAPYSYYGEYYLYLPNAGIGDIKGTANADSAGNLVFPTLDISNLSGPYVFVAKVYYYQNTYNVPQNPTTVGPKYNINITKRTSTTTLQTTVTSKASTTVTTKADTASTPNVTATTKPVESRSLSATTTTTVPVMGIDEEQKLLQSSGSTTAGSNLVEVTENMIKANEEMKLPPELKFAPESIILKTETAKVSMVDNAKGTVKFTGKAEPNQIVYLYVFSDPVVVSVKADSNGDWEYSLDKELVAGKHEIYVAVKNDDNTIKAKSSAFTFFVGKAIAASPEQNQAVATTAKSSNYLFYYTMFAVSLVTLIISVIFYLLTKKRIRQHELQLQG